MKQNQSLSNTKAAQYDQKQQINQQINHLQQQINQIDQQMTQKTNSKAKLFALKKQKAMIKSKIIKLNRQIMK